MGDWTHAHPDTIYYAKITGLDKDKNPTIGTQSSGPARVWQETKVKSAPGAGQSREKVYKCQTHEPLTPEHIVWTPDDDENTNAEGREIDEYETATSLADGTELIEVTLK